MYRIKRFFRKCRNVLRWIPTIWKDEDWDQTYIYDMLLLKLERQRDFFLSDRAYAANAKETANQIQTAIDLLHMTRDSWEFYECPVLEELDAKWGKGVLRTEPYGNDSYQLHIDIDGVKTEADKAQYNEEYKTGMERARKEYQKDKRTAFKYIADHIDYWWD
jgi:hypothetical protein